MNRTIILITTSFIISAINFFSNDQLIDAFDPTVRSIEWYVNFSHSIFLPQSAYYAESILLPLIGKLIGASNSLYAYKLLCSVITLLILPVVALVSGAYFQKKRDAIFFIILFGFSFQYFSSYTLGFPDPLAIMLLILIAFQKRAIPICFLVLFAGLTHFSSVLLGSISLIIIIRFGWSKKIERARQISAILVGLLLAKAILSFWFFIFDYNLTTRIDYIESKGLNFFIERYLSSPIEFWLTPGVIFIFVFNSALLYLFCRKKSSFATSALISITLGYIALFVTVDGLRVFAIVISGSYAYFLKTVVAMASADVAFKTMSHIRALAYFQRLKLRIRDSLILIIIRPIHAVLAFAIATAVFVLLHKAKELGLFVNHIPMITSGEVTRLIVVGGIYLVCLSLFVMLVILSYKLYIRLQLFVLLIFLTLLSVISLQYLRQNSELIFNLRHADIPFLFKLLIVFDFFIILLFVFKKRIFEYWYNIGSYILKILLFMKQIFNIIYKILYKLS